MNQFLIFLLGIVLGAGAVWVIMKKRAWGKMQEIKETRKQNILKELAEQDNIKTNQVADFLEVSRATAFRYLEELEQERKIEQIGAFGRNVEYKLKER